MKLYIRFFHMATVAILALGCKGNGTASDSSGVYTNPVIPASGNTSISFVDGTYYYINNGNGCLSLSAAKDPADLHTAEKKIVAYMESRYNLKHLWHPQLIRIDGIWYIYVTADDGNTDNHKMYVLENREKDPFDGIFEMKARLVTDKEDNWAMHGYVFSHNGKLYMTWSGWENRREYAERQNIYIASMSNPWTIDSDRVMISTPEHEWELQWINRQGRSIFKYPVFVNEAPFFFCNEQTDRAYIYFSASAQWTAFSCFGELSAEKDADLLNPASWSKLDRPVFRENREAKIFGPSFPYLVPSPDMESWYLVYSAFQEKEERSIFMQKIDIVDGIPVFGTPVPSTEKIPRVTL
ncbi:MAG: glycoside hydrolase family 43 protein [Bacteroidales bacterium]|nr:glycoside hydrolase family 43 protein [Bacteroides sp.]MCM1198475.1 glycoside hydrolase family 43 protein [Clostridium sp.]MCM1501793.1 glycoside hydrolase family 43 protein [Bacteroidales bacterium]